LTQLCNKLGLDILIASITLPNPLAHSIGMARDLGMLTWRKTPIEFIHETVA
jgi:hypothetical protein